MAAGSWRYVAIIRTGNYLGEKYTAEKHKAGTFRNIGIVSPSKNYPNTFREDTQARIIA